MTSSPLMRIRTPAAVPLLRPSLIAYNGYDAGLGNRLRVTMASANLAESESRDFFYVWPTGPLFGPRFSDLWHWERGRVIRRATSRLLARRWSYVDERLDWLTDAKRRERLWQIRTGSELRLPAGVRSWQEDFRRLTPVPQIEDTVRRFFDEHLAGVPYVGVMIRAHAVSHSKTRDASPVSWFDDRMRRLAAQDPDLRFFVSCDVPEIKRRIVRDHPGAVALDFDEPYNSTPAVRAAVSDLYLLASSGHLIGPHFSSFIEMAHFLADERISIESSVSVDPGVDARAAGLVRDPLRPAQRS